MTWRVIRQTPARGDQPAEESLFGMNIYLRSRAEEIAREYEGLAQDGAKFVIEEESREEI